MTRREAYAPIIAEILRQTLPTDAGGKLIIPPDVKPIRAVLRDRCPIRPKKGHNYKIWIDEIRVQLGMRAPVAGRGRPPKNPAAEIKVPDRMQGELFKEITPELRLIEVVIRAAIAGKNAAQIHAGAKELLPYPVVVRILDLAGQHKTPQQILRSLLRDERKARKHAPAIAGNSIGGIDHAPLVDVAQA